jgi:mannosyltransferase
MVRVIQGHPGFKGTVVIVGETTHKYEPYLNALKERIHHAGLSERFIFLGKQPFERIPDLFRGMSLVAALSRNEGFGLTVLEAMSSGTAVLASRAGAWADIIKPSFGRLVACDNLQQTTTAIEELLKQPTHALHAMGANARAEIEVNYAIEQEAKRLIDFYRSLQNQIK